MHGAVLRPQVRVPGINAHEFGLVNAPCQMRDETLSAVAVTWRPGEKAKEVHGIPAKCERLFRERAIEESERGLLQRNQVLIFGRAPALNRGAPRRRSSGSSGSSGGLPSPHARTHVYLLCCEVKVAEVAVPLGNNACFCVPARQRVPPATPLLPLLSLLSMLACGGTNLLNMAHTSAFMIFQASRRGL